MGTSTNPCSDIYGGTEAFSEPETQAIKNFTTRLNENGKLLVYMSLHSYGQYWLYSWGYTRQLPDDHYLLVGGLSLHMYYNDKVTTSAYYYI